MPKNVPSLKPKQLIKLLEQAGCRYYREGKGDHTLYMRTVGQKRKVVPIDMGQTEFSPPYVLRI
ncbi:MAG: type II toxin-antitoxin system HicA family toxin [Desulfovermiculus sp.]|nr:type II toxin-antitoxin system HicA family toxin [Desulfovermiculus sp.]